MRLNPDHLKDSIHAIGNAFLAQAGPDHRLSKSPQKRRNLALGSIELGAHHGRLATRTGDRALSDKAEEQHT